MTPYSSTVKPVSNQQVLYDICFYFWISRSMLCVGSCVKLDPYLTQKLMEYVAKKALL